MEIRLAKTAGFCFGVDRAVKLTYGLLDEGRKVATLGPLIHNPQTVEDLERRGALVADTPLMSLQVTRWSSAATASHAAFTMSWTPGAVPITTPPAPS